MISLAAEERSSPPIAAAIGVFLLSAATLMFEINLARIFSVAQFYHFAFMIVSLAMLGFGASGTWLALRLARQPQWGLRRSPALLVVLALGYGISAVGAYLFINWVPFDSFSIAWDWRQVALLFFHYLVLSLPFFCSGAVTSLLLARHPGAEGALYAVNLVGSAVGCLLALVLPGLVGGTGIVWLSGALSGVAAVVLVLQPKNVTISAVSSPTFNERRVLLAAAAVALIVICAGVLVISPPAVSLELSPYKGLSYALQVPEARILYRIWNSFSRVDLVASPTIRSLPGLSYRYLAPPPAQHGLFVDGDNMTPVLQLPPEVATAPDENALAFADYLPTAVAYRLRPNADALILGPRGGLEIWTALTQDVARIVAVEPNPLVVDAVARGSDGGPRGGIYSHEQVTTVLEHPRSFVRRTDSLYDLVVLTLTAPYRPIRSGAYSLAEDYEYTVEAFRDDLARLEPDGIFVVSRWVQTPPSESLRAFALAVTAVEEAGGDPATQIVAFRGYAMMTFLIKQRPFSVAELAAIREFAQERAFDMVYAPDLAGDEVNRYNVLESPIYYDAFTALLTAEDRVTWYADYPFDVAPPTDNHPFFGHFFTWSQTPQIIAELGKSWQPFGGAGYFVLVVLLLLSLAAAALLIGLPALALRARPPEAGASGGGWRLTLTYFGLLGIGFLFVEIPLMQRAILFLGHPAHAVTAVLFALLLFSGIGSAVSSRFTSAPVVMVLVGLVVVYALALPPLFKGLLGLPWIARLIVTVLALAPGGFLMGMPFPQGLRRLSARAPAQVPWAWATNGAMSVVASVLSALIALSVGFRWVLILGALCYAGVWAIARRWRVESAVREVP